MSEKGISYRQSWLRQVMDGKASPVHSETKLLLSRDSLLDATLTLFNECQQHSRTDHVANFVNKYKDAVSEIREARIVPSDFQVLDLVGRGQFGKVELVRCRHQPCNTVYALKTIPKKMATDPAMAMSVWEERDILTHANSQWLTQAHFAFQDDANLYLVMDYLPGGDLFSLMRRQEDLFTEDNVRFYFVEILHGVNAVHHMGYVHRDIKPENILLDQRGHLKLVDFGSAVRIGSSANGHCVGTASYMSPEVLRAADPDYEYAFAPEVDYWALGIILYEMLYFRNPFVSEDEMESSIEVIRNIMDWKNSLIFDDEIFQISDTCRSLIVNLITDKEHRFGCKEVTEHPFLESVGLSQIGEMTPPFIPQVSSEEDTSNFEPPAPGPSLTEARQGRSSFAQGDVLSQVAFLGYTHSSAQLKSRKTRARTSLALEGIPVSTLEQKWADRATNLRARCHELELQVTELEEKLRRRKPETADVGMSVKLAEDEVVENRKDAVPEKKSRPKPNVTFTAEVEKKFAETSTEESNSLGSGQGYMVTSQLRHENTKLKRLIAGLNVEIEEQRNRLQQYKSIVARHSEAEAKAKERIRDLETRLRTLSRRRSMQARRVDEALADEHRQMLTKIREQNDSIAMLEASKQSLQKELEKSQRISETLHEELELHKSHYMSDTIPEDGEEHLEMLKTPKKSETRGSTEGERGDSNNDGQEEYSGSRPSHSSTPYHPRRERMSETSSDGVTPNRFVGVTSSSLMDADALKESLLERDRVVIELTRQVSSMLKELNSSRVDQNRSKTTEEELRAAVEKYEEKVRTTNEENKTLQQKYERMCIEKIEKYDENRKLKKSLVQLESRADNLQAEVDEFRLAETVRKNSINESSQRADLLETQVRNLTASNGCLLAETKELTAELRASRERQEQAEKTLAERERELTENLSIVQQQRDAASADARSKKMALSEANALLASSRQRERAAREEAETTARRLDELRSRLNDAERNAVEQSASAARVVAQEEALQKVQRQLQQEASALQAAEMNLQDVNTKLENARVMNEVLQDRVKELETVEIRFQNLNSEMIQLRQQQRSKDDKCERLEMKLQQKVSQLETERSTGVDRRAKEAAEASQKMNDLRARLRSELNEAKARCEEQESRVAQLNIEISQLSRAKQSLEGQVEALTKRAHSSEEEAIRLKEECAQHITAMQQLRREVVGLQRELDAAEDSYDAMSSAKTGLESQLQALTDEFAVERLRSTSTIQQQGKLIDMLKGNVENATGKRKGIKHLFGGSRTGFSGTSVSSAALQVLQPSNPPNSTSPSKSSSLKRL